MNEYVVVLHYTSHIQHRVHAGDEKSALDIARNHFPVQMAKLTANLATDNTKDTVSLVRTDV